MNKTNLFNVFVFNYKIYELKYMVIQNSGMIANLNEILYIGF